MNIYLKGSVISSPPPKKKKKKKKKKEVVLEQPCVADGTSKLAVALVDAAIVPPQ